MKNKQMYGLGLAGVLLCWTLLVFRYSYHLFFLEQHQLFIFEKEYALILLSTPGGTMEYLTQFCIQFFKFNFIGSFLISFLLLLIGVLLHILFKNKKEQNSIVCFEFLIPFFLFINLLDINYYIRGIFGFLLCVTALLIYKRLIKSSFLQRLIFAVILAIILFWIAAPFQSLFLVALFCMELINKGFNKGKTLLFLFIALVFGYLVYEFGGDNLFRQYILPDGVFSSQISPDWTAYASWVLLIIAILSTPLLNKLVLKIRSNAFMFTLQIIIIITAILLILPKHEDKKSMDFKRLHYYAINNNWDDLLKFCKEHPQETPITLNYQNLALAEKGILADSLFAYTQNGSYGLFAPWDRSIYTAFVSQRVSYFYGDIAFAQRLAFEGNVSSTTKGFPETMKTLIRTNILQQEFQVAAKYINYLQLTFFYKDWADKQFSYLSNIESKDDDPEYIGKRMSLKNESHLLAQNSLLALAMLNPENTKLRDFALCSYLLNKDLEGYLQCFNSYFENTQIKQLSNTYYEGLILCSLIDSSIVDKYQIPEQIKEEFERYISIYQGFTNTDEQKEWLSIYFTHTFWFYYHFTK